MSHHATIKAALEAHAGLAALVGPRIRSDLARPEDAYPFVIYKRSLFKKHRGLDGSVHAVQEAFDIECWGNTRSEAVAVFEQALDALEAAGLEPEDGSADGIDPELLERANVVTVEFWDT